MPYNQGTMDVQQMVIYGVSFDVIGKQPIVLLKTVEGNKFLPIWIGHPEAAAILIKLQGTKLPRPMTHDLLTNLIGQFEAEMTRITVTELKESTFYAKLTLLKDGAEIDIDSRPSDALALAVRTDAPIFASNELIVENAIEFEREVDDTEEIIEDFRDFLEKVIARGLPHRETSPTRRASASGGRRGRGRRRRGLDEEDEEDRAD